VDKGCVKIRADAEEITLEQGQIVFHKPNEFHSIRSLDSSPNFFVLAFSCPSAAMSLFDRYSTRLDKKLKGYLFSIIQEAEKTFTIPKNNPYLKKLERKADAPLGGEQLLKTYLEQLLIFLLHSITSQIYILPQKEEGRPLVSAIRAYLADRVEMRIQIEDICGGFGFSRSYLSRLFQKETGQSLAQYATKLKIDKAKQWIRETDMNFAQIAVALAFENPQYFSWVFKRCTGMTPTEFKNSAQV